MADVIKEFLVSLGFTVDSNTERKFTASLRNVVIQANLISDAIEGTAKAVASSVDAMSRNFASLEWASERTKSSVQNLRGFAYAFSQIGGSAAGAGAVVERFAATLRTNPGMQAYLKSLGVSTQGRQSVDQVIDLVQRLHKQFQGQNYGVGAQIAGQFGVDEQSYFQIANNADGLAKFRKEYDDTTKSLGLNNDDAAKKWREFLQDMQKTSTIFQTVLEKVFTDLEPKIKEGLEKFDKWLIDNEPAIKEAISNVGSAIAGAATDFGNLASQITPVISQVNALVEAITGQKGLTVAIEALVGAAVLGRLLRMLSVLGGGGSGGGLFAMIAAILGLHQLSGWQGLGGNPMASPGGNNKPITPEEYSSHFLSLGDVWRIGSNKVKSWFGMGPSDTGSSPGDGSSAKLSNASSSERDLNALESYRFWRSRGFSRNQALGMVGNEQGESEFNPHIKGDWDPKLGRYTAGGSMQWHQDRRDAILKATGIDVYSPDTTHQQMLDATWWELNHTHKSALAALKNATTPQEAAGAAVNYYELPKNRAAATYTRGVYANRWDGKLTDVPRADPYRYMTGPGAAADNSQRVVNQKTTITVHGAADPHATAGAISRAQNSVNSNILRDVKGAVR